jgi:hypothetical protein
MWSLTIPHSKERTINALAEAIEIVESMMTNKDRNGLGRLHILLCILQEQFFTDPDDTAELPRCSQCGDLKDPGLPYCSWGCPVAAEGDSAVELAVPAEEPFPAA